MEYERTCENFPRIILPSQQQYRFRKHYYNFEENVERFYDGCCCHLKSYPNLQQNHLVYFNTIPVGLELLKSFNIFSQVTWFPQYPADIFNIILELRLFITLKGVNGCFYLQLC